MSLYNDTKQENNKVVPIHPTPVIGMVGLIENTNNICKKSWLNSDDQIWLIGLNFEVNKENDPRITLSASCFLEYLHGLKTGRPPEIDLNLEKQVQLFLRNIILKKIIKSAHDVGDGGLAVAISESCISSDFGANIILPETSERLDRILFAEGGARVLISLSNEKVLKLQETFDDFIKLNPNLFSIKYIGKVTTEKKLKISQQNKLIINLNISDIEKTYENSIYKRVSN